MRVDIHQHFWSEPLVAALSERRELPFVRWEHGLTVLYLAEERPFVLELEGETATRRAELAWSDGLDLAILCISSPLAIEWLPGPQARELIAAYHEGARAAGEPFRAWGAVPLRTPDPDDVDRVLDEDGCVGVSLPAGALGGVAAIDRVGRLLERLEARDAPLFIHPGPGGRAPARADGAFAEPLWWAAMTRYVAGMQEAWLAFNAEGRRRHPRLRVVFAMLAGLAPLHLERLRARGGAGTAVHDASIFYDVSSYGPVAVAAMAAIVGPEQLVYGSDRPVVDPNPARGIDWASLAEGGTRVLGSRAAAGVQ